MPGFSTIGSLYDGSPRANQPTAIFVDKCPAQEKMTGGRPQASPIFTSIARPINCAAFTKSPSAPSVTKNRPQNTRVHVGARYLDSFPVFTAVTGLHEVCARLVLCLQFINVGFTNEPSSLVVGKIDVTQDISRRLRFCLPRFATIKRSQQGTSASHSPATVLIEKENCMKPGEC